MIYPRKMLVTIALGGVVAALFPLAFSSAAAASTIPSSGFPPPESALTFLAPLTNTGISSGNLDSSLDSDITVLVVNSATSQTVESFSYSGAGPARLQVSGGGMYHVNWKVTRAETLGSDAIIIEENGLNSAGVNLPPIILGTLQTAPHQPRTIPINFSIQNNPVIRARQMRLQEDSSVQVANQLKTEFGLNASTSAELLEQEQYDAVQTAQALQSVYNLTPLETASVLQQVQYTVDEVAGALQSVYNLTGQDTAGILKLIGDTANQVAGALQSVCQQSANQVASILQGLNYSVDTIARTLSSVFGQTAQGVANILQSIGYTASQVTSALSNVFGLAQQTIGNILKAAGYTASEISSAIQGFFGTVGSWFKNLF